MDAATGQLVSGRFEVLDRLARGGHSVVHRGLDRETGQHVAIKVLNAVAAASPEYTVRLVREHRAMTELVGTACVRAIAMGATEDGCMCLVMELLRGTDFGDYVVELERRHDPLGVRQLVEILTPVVETLVVAHDKGITHRDLKPGNIFLLDADLGGGVRLLDFGLARVPRATPLTRDGMILGSPSYIAPEVWAGRPSELDHRVDVYSLGAIVFRALAGRVPFEGSDIREKIRLVKDAPRPSLHAVRDDLPPSVDEWVEQVLAVDPDVRFANVRAAWNAFLGTMGMEPRPRPVASCASP